MREKELKDLLDKHRKSNGEYDVVVPSSGGKDSGMIAHRLKYEYNMNPLTITWAPIIYTDIGIQNIHNMSRVGNLANEIGTPPGDIHRILTRLSCDILGDPFQPFIYGQINYPLQAAIRYQIPLVMYGENGEVEYGGDMKNVNSPTRDYKTDHNKHFFSGLSPQDLTDYNISEKDIKPYMAPSNDALDNLGVELHFWSYYKKWIPQEIIYYCVGISNFLISSITKINFIG